MIELHGWECPSDIPFKAATPILLQPRHIVAICCAVPAGEDTPRVTIRCLGPVVYVVEESYKTVKGWLMSGRVET